MDGGGAFASLGITCPKCGHLTQVVDSRPAPGWIRRRRKCLGCGFRVTTREMVAEKIDQRQLKRLARRLVAMRGGVDQIKSIIGELLPGIVDG